jgi:uncharacterized protein (TIGR02145 family)
MTKTIKLNLTIALLGAMAMLFSNCKKDDDEKANTVKDIDGNVYKTVKIGEQVWMAENLRTTHYNDGISIPTGHIDEQWIGLETGAYAIFPHTIILDGLNSDTEVMEAYGALYNWFAVETGKLCPAGWHVPSLDEWTTLINNAGGVQSAGGKLKSIRTSPEPHPRWWGPNTGATDDFGFSALPGGVRQFSDGRCFDIGGSGYLWSNTAEEPTLGSGVVMEYSEGYAFTYDGFHQNNGFSVRCIQD